MHAVILVSFSCFGVLLLEETFVQVQTLQQRAQVPACLMTCLLPSLTLRGSVTPRDSVQGSLMPAFYSPVGSGRESASHPDAVEQKETGGSPGGSRSVQGGWECGNRSQLSWWSPSLLLVPTTFPELALRF